MSDAASGGTGSNLLTTFLDAVKSALGSDATTLAKALGLWMAARAALSTVASGVAAAVSQQTISDANAKYQGVPASVAALATAIVRNVLPDSTGAAGTPPANYPPPQFPNGINGGTATDEAARSGINGDRFAVLVGATGMSYGVVDAIRMLNRATGLWSLTPGPNYATSVPLYVAGTDLGTKYGITANEFANVVAHSDIRPEYIPDLLKLARDSVSGADAVMMAVKEVVDKETAQDLYAAAGGIPDQFPALVDAAGDSAGVEHAVGLWMHGYITLGELQQILAMSRTNDRFYPYYLPYKTSAGPLSPSSTLDADVPETWQSGWQIAANTKYLGAFEIGALVKAGTISADLAETWLLQYGLPAAQAAAFSIGQAGPSASVKEQSEAMLLDEYAAGMYSEAQATSALEAMGYTASAVPLILESAAARMSIAARNEAVSRVRASYLHGSLSANQAKIDLSELNIPQTAITNYLTAWTVELATPTAHLSESMVGWLVEHGKITSATAVSKWQAMGLTADDATLLLQRYPPAVTEPVVSPTEGNAEAG